MPMDSVPSQLVEPEVALAVPDRVAEWEPPDPAADSRKQAIRYLADQAHGSGDWSELGDLYDHLAELAWRDHRYATALRLLLAARIAAELAGDTGKVLAITGILAMRHRLQTGFIAAERWNRAILDTSLSPVTAAAHAVAWRELAAISEVAGTYERGLSYCSRAIGICEEFPQVAEIAELHVKALLQSTSLERLRGRFDNAADAVAEARRRAEAAVVPEHTRGLVALREAGLEVVIGRNDLALATFRRAEEYFRVNSAINLRLAQVRQIACLRALGRSPEALALADRLLAEIPDQDRYRLGQVLLERAEVLEELADGAGVAATLEQARPYYENSDSVEAVRWHRHRARHLIMTGGSATEAAVHLRVALDIAIRPGRRDITRTSLALHDLLRLPAQAALPFDVMLLVGRAALVAADLQRDSLNDPSARWALHELREEVYAAQVQLHLAAGDADAVAQIIEIGRADLLNQVLSTDRGEWPETLAELPVVRPPSDPRLLDGVFAAAEAASQALLDGSTPRPEPLNLPGELPSDAELDEMADVIALVQIGDGPQGWWSSVAVRTRGSRWRVSERIAPPALSGLIARLAAGQLLPARGVTTATWAALAEFLLPDREVWSGRADRPRSVVLCPDPRLWQIPYAALLRDGVHLVDVAELTLTASLGTLRLLHRRTGRPVVASEAAVSLLDESLPGHAAERTALDAWPGGHRPVTDLGDLGSGTLLYVSGRGTAPGASVLGPAAVTLERLASISLPGLLLLSGCWSGTAASRYGRDPLSLAVGGLLGGADVVVAGIGLIGETATALLAGQLLELVSQGLPVRCALRQAQRLFRDRYPELGPYDWAGLCMIGVGRAESC